MKVAFSSFYAKFLTYWDKFMARCNTSKSNEIDELLLRVSVFANEYYFMHESSSVVANYSLLKTFAKF